MSKPETSTSASTAPSEPKADTATTANPPGATGPGAGKPAAAKPAPDASVSRPKEIGGPKGPEPTRFGDWERDGRCVDF